MIFNSSIYIFYEMATLEAFLHLFYAVLIFVVKFLFCDIFKVPLSQSLLLNIFHYFVIFFFLPHVLFCLYTLIHFSTSSFTCLKLFVKVP